MGLAVVDQLGDDLETAWRAQSYEPSCFPDLAATALERVRLHEALSPDAIIDWACGMRLPQQADPTARFGQPPITLFRSRRFYISALFWVDGTTSIHDHGFSGAFQVLHGSSIETRFSFRPSRDVDGHLRFGELTVDGSALLRRGDVRRVPAGPSYIHSLFHLPRPTVSLVVRTFSDAEPGVQLNYFTAGIAHDPFLSDDTLDRTLQVVELLRKIEDPAFETRVGDLLEAADLYSAFRIVMACTKVKDKSLVRRLIGRVRDGVAAERFHKWTSEAERIAFIHGRRADVHDADLRFLLAVLLNAHRRVDALSLVASYAPAIDPAVQIASWLRQLSEIRARLQVGSFAWEPSLLGLPAFTESLETTLVNILRGREGTLSGDEVGFIERLRALPALAPLFVA